MGVMEIDIQAVLRRIACGETTVEDAEVLRAILEMLGFQLSAGDAQVTR